MNDLNSGFRLKASFDFDKARNKAFINDIINKILRKNNELFQFDEIKYLLSPHGMSYRGMHAIPINRIVGSEGRYNDFDRDFLPLRGDTRSRWENIDVAKMREVVLPPISVYKIRNYYFVRDGNHRVSVARELKQEFIDAEVTELFVKVNIEELTEKGLLIAESMKYFLDKTKFDEIFPQTEINLTNPWGYYRLIEHIKTYQYLLSESEHRKIPWEEAVKRWYNELFLKLVKLIKTRKVLRKFPGREVGDLYIWVMDHWHFLKENKGPVSMEKALEDYAFRYGNGKIGKIFIKVFGWLNKFNTKRKERK